MNTAESTTVENVRRRAPSRENNRSSYSLSNENFDMIWQEAKRLNLSMTGAINVLLDELRQYRKGERVPVKRRMPR